MIKKIFFWSFTIAVGFVNPLISVVLIVLYYVPKVISDLTRSCEPEREKPHMKSYSDDIVEEMK